MKVSQFVVGLMVIFVGFILYQSTTAFIDALREHRANQRASALAAANAAWLDAQVAMSLERSLTQVALARDPTQRQPLIAQVAAQRGEVNESFETALKTAAAIVDDETPGGATFVSDGRRLIADLADLRDALDEELREAGAGDARGLELVSALIALIDRSAITRENLRAPSEELSGYYSALTEIQRLAWNAREYAGRIRTPYAVATLNSEPLDMETAVLIDEMARTSNRAWGSLNAVAGTIELPSALISAIRAADAAYFQEHVATMAAVDDWLARVGSAQAATPRIDFDMFFAESSAALGSIRQVAMATGDEIARFWEERQAASLSQLWVNGLKSVLAVLIVSALSFVVRQRLVRPITGVTDALRRVAAGDLDAFVTRRAYELKEIAALRDVVERFRANLKEARQVEEEAKTDHLTGLPNRRHLEELFASEERRLLTLGDCFIYIDLDEFKPINDGFGHAVGDKVLQEIARRLRRSSDEAWRLGGDEFGLIWRGAASKDELLHRADALLEEIGKPVQHGERDLYVSASIGIARYDQSVVHLQELVSRADVAMFTSKQRAVGKVEIYSDEFSVRRFGLDNRREIHAALEEGQFQPMFQPQFELASGRVIGFEALARWRRCDGAVLKPADFMAMIDYFELQGALDLSIAEQTLDAMRGFLRQRGTTPRFSINLSEEALASSETRKSYLELFARHAECLPSLTIEVTENALTDRSATAIQHSLAAFARAGVRLSMDDFGTGYGSFRHLQEYRFDEIKIDRSFVASIGLDRSSDVIIEGFLAIAKGLNATVVAEGIENTFQRDRLQEMGCQIGQGFLLGDVVAPDALPQFSSAGGARGAAALRSGGAA